MTTSRPFDLWTQSRGQEAIKEKCDLSYNQVWEPPWRFGWSLFRLRWLVRWVSAYVSLKLHRSTLAHPAVHTVQRHYWLDLQCFWVRGHWNFDLRWLRKQTGGGPVLGPQSPSSALKKESGLCPNHAWNCLLRKAAPTVLLLTLINDSLKTCCILLLSLFWISFIELPIESLGSPLRECHFQSEMKQSSFL